VDGRWVEVAAPQQFTWENDKQMSVHKILLPNFSELASLESGQIFLQFYNPNTGLSQSIYFYASNKGGKKQADQQIDKKIARHSITSTTSITETSPIMEAESPPSFLEVKEPDIFEQLNWLGKEEEQLGDQLLFGLLAPENSKEEETEVKEPTPKRRKLDELEPNDSYQDYPKYSKQEENETEQKPFFSLEDLEQWQGLPYNTELGTPPMDPHYPLFFGSLGTTPSMFAWCFLNFGYLLWNGLKEKKKGLKDNEQRVWDLLQMEELFLINKRLH